MKSTAFHLNLLMESERVSSSPVRFRVMLPVLSMLACLGLAVWWAILGGQLMLAKTSLGNTERELREHDAAHRDVLAKMAEVNDLTARLAQLDCYSNSILRRGEMLASLAEVMPLKVQLVKLEIPAPAHPAIPKPPPPKTGQKKVVVPSAPLGPTGYVERTTLTLAGRTPKETPVMSLMESLEGDGFTNALQIVRNPRDPNLSPKVRSFKQDVAKKGEGTRMLVFDIEYLLRGRRFDR